jgi:hypothetical protein
MELSAKENARLTRESRLLLRRLRAAIKVGTVKMARAKAAVVRKRKRKPAWRMCGSGCALRAGHRGCHIDRGGRHPYARRPRRRAKVTTIV